MYVVLPPKNYAEKDTLNRLAYDYDFYHTKPVRIAVPDELPDTKIFAVIGASGCGKTIGMRQVIRCATLYNQSNFAPSFNRRDTAIIDYWDYADGVQRLTSVGLNTVSSWVLPYRYLSGGEQFRFWLAFMSDEFASFGANQTIIIDEFGSLLDSATAESVARCLVDFSCTVKARICALCNRVVVGFPAYLDFDSGRICSLQEKKNPLSLNDAGYVNGNDLNVSIT